jgi:hypothetical protein
MSQFGEGSRAKRILGRDHLIKKTLIFFSYFYFFLFFFSCDLGGIRLTPSPHLNPSLVVVEVKATRVAFFFWDF